MRDSILVNHQAIQTRSGMRRGDCLLGSSMVILPLKCSASRSAFAWFVTAKPPAAVLRGGILSCVVVLASASQETTIAWGQPAAQFAFKVVLPSLSCPPSGPGHVLASIAMQSLVSVCGAALVTGPG